MPTLFDFRSKKRSLQERKQAHKEVFLNNLESFKHYINLPFTDMSEYQNAVQRYFSQSLVTLEEKFEHSSLIQTFKEQYAEKIIGLTERLDILREIAEQQQINSKIALLGYQKTLDSELSDINKSVQALFQQVNKDIAKLLGLLTRVSFKQSDSFFDAAKRIRVATYLDLFSIQNDNLVSPDYLLDALPEFVASEELPQTIRAQLQSTFEKLNTPKNTKFMLVSLNAAFNTVPNRVSEIGCDEKASITARIQGLKSFLDEKSIEPLEHYLMTAQAYFSLLLRLDKDYPRLVDYIEEHLTEEQLFDDLLQRFKKDEQARLVILKQAFRTPLDRQLKTLKEINHELGGSSERLNDLIDEYNGRLRALELNFEANINDYHKLSSFSEMANYYSTILGMIKLHSIEIREKAAEYELVYRLLKNGSWLDKVEIDIFFKEIKDSDYRKVLVQSLTEKVFYLLGKVPSSKFGDYIENLLQVTDTEKSQLASSEQPDYLGLFKKELSASIRGKHLESFIGQQSEKICDYLHNECDRRDCGPFRRLNGYLNYCDRRQLETLANNRLDLKDTIQRVISTKQLLDFQNKYHHASLWEVCEWFYEVDKDKRSLPFFTTPQDKYWFFSTMDIIGFLKNAITGINNKENPSRASFFFLNSGAKAKKREALDQLTEQLKALPNLMDSQALDEKIKNWETEFGAVIDKQRYRFYLVVCVMILQTLKYYILGQTVETKSRHSVERLKERLYEANAAMQAHFQERVADTSPLARGLTP